MRPWFILSTLAFACVHAQQGVVTNIPSSCSSTCTILGSLEGTDPAILCTEEVRGNVQRCLSCILIIGGKSITTDLMTSTQRAANAFTSACGSASFKLDPILVQNPANPTATVPSEPGSNGNTNGASPVQVVGISGIGLVWGVTMLLL